MTAPRLTCHLPPANKDPWRSLIDADMGVECGYEADSYSELRAHMGAAHKSR